MRVESLSYQLLGLQKQVTGTQPCPSGPLTLQSSHGPSHLRVQRPHCDLAVPSPGQCCREPHP
jgi:hypothetical protein